LKTEIIQDVVDKSEKLNKISPRAIKGVGKSLLYQQAEDELRDCITVLRGMNGELTGETLQLKQSIALNDEQMILLKKNIRDLESSLVREREFNSANREINVEYLVNILRKFLLTVDLSERAKLVTVLCSILHLRGEDSKLITAKWAVKGGGLVGWLIPRRQQTGSALSNDDYSEPSDTVLPVTTPKRAIDVTLTDLL